MAYAIEPKSIKDFIAMGINLPRFQRKQTWKPISNFKLCISVFKNYPIGVVIINKNKEGNWLLDGRQRFNALTQISSNPIEVYKWAMKFINFKNSSQPDEIKALYWDKINEYLQKEFEEDVYYENNIEDEQEVEEVDFEHSNYHSFDPREQKEGLNVLLDYILMVHNIRGGKSSWERNFDFSNKIERLTYYKVIKGVKTFSPNDLVKTMEEILQNEKAKKSGSIISKETFIDYYVERYFLTDKVRNSFKNLVEQRWTDIEASFKTISSVKKILEDSRVGVIEITAASDLDAQNIFSLVNDGGTQLTAEELLSAKPYWNIKVMNASDRVRDEAKKLYNHLDVEQPEDIVRWDLCATLISRIDRQGIIFDKRNMNSFFASQITLGFKLFSALYINGISSSNVSEIERTNTLNWETEFESLIDDLNNLCDLIADHKYFKCMLNWGQSVMSLTSNTIALEFLTIIYKEWIRIGKKIVDSSETRRLKRNAIILLDKLVFEYSNKQWRGSSDTKLAKDLLNIPDRLTPKSRDEWNSLLENLADGKVIDQIVTQNLVKPILYHGKFLSEEYPSINGTNISYDLDHIFPKALFAGNDNVNVQYKDSLCNLEILSSIANEKKNDKKLEEIFDESIKNEISRSSGIKQSDFSKYSDITNLDDLVKYRLKLIKKQYNDNRDSMLNN